MSTKTISLRVSPNLDRRLRVEAAKRDLDRSAAIRQAVEDWLNKAGAVNADADTDRQVWADDTQPWEMRQ